MTWLLVILLYGADVEVPTRMVREFPTRQLCDDERAHLARQALPAGTHGRVVLWCEGKA